MGITADLERQYDVVIVGAGAAGAAYIHKLVNAGLKVLAIEKGPYFKNHSDDFIENELGIFSHLWDNNPYEVTGEAFRRTPNLGRAVGGGTLAWTAVALRFFERDFEFGSRWGHIEGTSVRDWPIGLKTLEPYYDEAEQHMGVSGGPTPWDASAVLPPNPPLPLYPGSEALKQGLGQLGLRSTPGRIATNSQPYNDSPECVHCGFCRSGCRIDAKYQADKVLIEPALETGLLTLSYLSTVTKIITSHRGHRAKGVEFIDDESGESHRVKARFVVVCNNPIETPRLLLASRSNAHPNGIGNRYDQIGRGFFAHLGIVGYGQTHALLNSSIGHNMGNLMTLDSCDRGSENGYGGGFTLLSLNGAGAGVLAIDPLEQFNGVALKEKVAAFNHSLFMVSFVEGVPVADNRIQLSTTEVDEYGIPQAHVHYEYHENDMMALTDAQGTMDEVLTASGAYETHISREFESHPMGGMAMGHSPQESATDRWGRVHGVKNLYIGGASLFVTGSSVNPTLTLHALALRSADKLIREFRRRYY
ncbi:GMC oxidoreductase [Teredinibacter purpureus]|uniref:GMC oxidoreductase n=1 Tax=Teredinibacter purpureus TaxID=2731756 RepID=UPI0005F86F90|nr:GMC family oxidoreductase [Teredinibacter purpureus]